MGRHQSQEMAAMREEMRELKQLVIAKAHITV